MLAAFCFRNGCIEFGEAIPKGALCIGIGGRTFRRTVEANARLAYDNKTLLVPGVPEADNDDEALDAVARFVERVRPRRGIKKAARP